MKSGRAVSHLIWAGVAIGAYFIGSKNNGTQTADSLTSSPSASRAAVAASGTAPASRGEIISAIPTKGWSTAPQDLGDPHQLVIDTRRALKEIMADDDPLAAHDAMSACERERLALGVLVDELSGGAVEERALIEKNLLEIDPRSFARLLEMRIALKQASHPDPVFRPAAYERLDLSPELEEFVEESSQRTLHARPRRNAQNIASVFASAVAAGADFGNEINRENVVAALAEGVQGGGEWATTTFQVQAPAREIREALAHIDFDMGYVAD